jgi:hypothetical protein
MAQQNPFTPGGAGENAFKAAYDRLKKQSELEKQNIGRDYSTAYQRLRQQGYGMGLGASAQRGLSGGQAAGVRAGLGARQAEQLGNLMQGQETAFRQQKVGESSIYSNALLEGQQAQEMEMSNRQAAGAQQQRINAILADGNLTPQQKYDSLIAEGLDQNKALQQSGLGDVQTYGEDKNTFFGLLDIDLVVDVQTRYQNELKNAKTQQEKDRILQNYRQKQETALNTLMSNMGITREQAIARLERKGITLI